MELSEVVSLINNLDYEEGLKRNFSPKYSLIQLNRTGEVEAVYRFKKPPTDEQQVEVLKKHRGTIQIPAMLGMFATVNSLEARIAKSLPLFSSLKEASNKLDY